MKNEKTKNIVYSAMFAAIIFGFTMLHIPIGAGGYIHVGDAMIYIASLCLGAPYAILASAIGGAVSDLASGFAVYAIPTAIIKTLIALPFVLIKRKSKKLLTIKSALLTILSGAITVFGYFVADLILYREGAIVDLGPNLVQAIGSAIVFIIFAFSLDKLNVRKKVFKLGD